MSRGSKTLSETIRELAMHDGAEASSPFSLRVVTECVAGGYKAQRTGSAGGSDSEDTITMSLDDKIESGDVVVVVELKGDELLIVGRL